MLRCWLATLIVILLVSNTVGTALLSSWDARGAYHAIIPYAAGFGLLLGQVALLIFWGVLSNEPSWQRLPRAIGLTIFLFYSWCIGALAAKAAPPLETSVAISLFLVVFYGLFSIPFRLVNWVFGWRIMIPGTGSRNEQFTIRNIFVWTFVIALLTILGNAIVDKSGQIGAPPPVGRLWQFGFIVVAIGFFLAALSLPLLHASLSPQPKATVWSAFGIVLVASPPILHSTIYVLLGITPTAEQRLLGIVAWYAFFATLSLMIAGPLLILRRFGYRLIAREPEHRHDSPTHR